MKTLTINIIQKMSLEGYFMTREEALDRKKYIVSHRDSSGGEIFGLQAFSEFELIEHINKIYDDFESRTCSSCKFYGDIWFRDCTIAGCTKLRISVGKTFSCNKWESKDG